MNEALSFKEFYLTEEEKLDEVLSISGRRKKARDAKRRKTQLKLARKRAKLRMAKPEVLKKRAKRQARDQIVKKFTKGKSKKGLSDLRKADLEKRLSRPALQKRLGVITKRLMPKKRRAEIARKKGHSSGR